ncbi:Uu.00g094350.m01.CDS01 [Anthostomella pinea]|uniref:Uu.00g094350.m01.CDS01 n=1 Tax=Anthostomella pinea TaxID=933095 RepID=A0AAI8YI92_9PEZI|nr:Uu.00g094350.m01.CDS01 [Anthostomella pinea]
MSYHSGSIYEQSTSPGMSNNGIADEHEARAPRENTGAYHENQRSETFHLFPSFPPEIRYMIWRQSSDKRMISFRFVKRTVMDPHVNRESRSPTLLAYQSGRFARETLRAYGPGQFAPLHVSQRGFFFNMDLDILDLPRHFQPLHFLERADLAQLRNLACPELAPVGDLNVLKRWRTEEKYISLGFPLAVEEHNNNKNSRERLQRKYIASLKRTNPERPELWTAQCLLAERFPQLRTIYLYDIRLSECRKSCLCRMWEDHIRLPFAQSHVLRPNDNVVEIPLVGDQEGRTISLYYTKMQWKRFLTRGRHQSQYAAMMRKKWAFLAHSLDAALGGVRNLSGAPEIGRHY